MNGGEQSRESWWQRIQPILNKEFGWLGLPVPPSAAQIIARSDLPGEARELVSRIVRRTRLRRGEKRDVARELCGHFQDGIEAGTTASELIRLFGDENAAAKLIRRGKLRNRGIIWKSWIAMCWGVTGVVGVFLCAYVIFAVRLALSERVISRDYLAEFNAPALAVPVEERGWTILQPVLTPSNEFAKWEDDDGVERDLLEAKPGNAGWAIMLDFVASNQDKIEIIRRAASAPRMAYIASISEEVDPAASDPLIRGSLIGVLLPHLGGLRWSARLLSMDLRCAEVEGDGERIVRDIRAMRRLALGATEYPALICGLVGIAINALADQSLGQILLRQPDCLSNDHLRELAHDSAAMHPHAALQPALVGERAWFLDSVQRVYTDDGKGSGIVDLPAMSLFMDWIDGDWPQEVRGSRGLARIASPLAVMAMPDRREMVAFGSRFYDRGERLLSQPMWEWLEPENDLGLESDLPDSIQEFRYGLMLMLAPSMTRAAQNKERAVQQQEAMQVAIALELHRRATGHWPQSLDELVPSMLPSVPKDRFTGGPIGYALRDGNPVVYSVGLDRDDDGGRAPVAMENDRRNWNADEWISREELAKALREDPESVPDGDWILWPPQDD